MDYSVVGATYDLLEFEGQGNFGQFDRSFQKAIAPMGAISMLECRKLRNIAFAHLRNAGYIDVRYSGKKTIWSTAPSTLVQRAEAEFVLVGGSIAANALVNATSPAAVRQLRNADEGLAKNNVQFFPNILRVTATNSDIEVIAQKTNLSVSYSYQQRLFDCLPSLQSVLDDGLVDGDDGPLFDPDSTEHLNVSARAWVRYLETRPFEPGLYRLCFKHAPPKYLVASAEDNGSLRSSWIEARDWALIAASARLGMTIRCRYQKAKRRLLVSRALQKLLPLPYLLERALRSGTLLNPTFPSTDWVAYDGIANRSIQALTSGLPIFHVESTA